MLYASHPMIWTLGCRISGFDIRASECDLDASRRSTLHLNMRPISITIDHSVTNVQQTKLSAEAGVAMLNVLHIGKGASHWNGNWGGGDFLIARYTVLYTYCFFGPFTPIPFYSPLTLPSYVSMCVNCTKQWEQKASGSTRQALQNAVCQWNSSMQTDCGVARQRFQIQHSEAEINFYVVRYCTKHKWCVHQLCSSKRQRTNEVNSTNTRNTRFLQSVLMNNLVLFVPTKDKKSNEYLLVEKISHSKPTWISCQYNPILCMWI